MQPSPYGVIVELCGESGFPDSLKKKSGVGFPNSIVPAVS